jgi:hypothetical protein
LANYLEPGLGPEHIPELIHMATDLELRGPESEEKGEDEDPDFWGPLHAIRALGQLHAETAIEPLVNLLAELKDDEWMFEENDEELNTFIISDLLQLKVVETLPLIERAFEADKVDEYIVDLDDVLVEFGLKEREVVESPFLDIFKEMSASFTKRTETPSPSPEESYELPPPPARTPSDTIIKFSGKRVTKKKGKKKR